MRQEPYAAHIVRLASTSKLPIPKRVQQYYGLQPGGKVVLWVKGRRLFVQPYRSSELAGSRQKEEQQPDAHSGNAPLRTNHKLQAALDHHRGLVAKPPRAAAAKETCTHPHS
jgi:bifunctional DNA-binding transcriptional regulator/antitoxin component of YhaV-PrlF toxin-antitoxin module